MNSSSVQNAKLIVKRLTETAKLPIRGTKYAAGYDLHSDVDIVIPSKGKSLTSTGIAISLPYGSYGRIAPRSGLAHKHFIDVGAGVIDVDYRGEVMVLLFNHSDKDFEVKKGDRIAQLIVEAIMMTDLEEVKELDKTVRGEGGFGSTGVKAIEENGNSKV